jgi:hypothetical protein
MGNLNGLFAGRRSNADATAANAAAATEKKWAEYGRGMKELVVARTLVYADEAQALALPVGTLTVMATPNMRVYPLASLRHSVIHHLGKEQLHSNPVSSARSWDQVSCSGGHGQSCHDSGGGYSRQSTQQADNTKIYASEHAVQLDNAHAFLLKYKEKLLVRSATSSPPASMEVVLLEMSSTQTAQLEAHQTLYITISEFKSCFCSDSAGAPAVIWNLSQIAPAAKAFNGHSAR